MSLKHFKPSVPVKGDEGRSKDITNPAKQFTVSPAKSVAVLMICPDTQRKDINAAFTAIRNAGFYSYKIIYANGNLQISQILAKSPDTDIERAMLMAHTEDWFITHKVLMLKALGINEYELTERFCNWDSYIVQHTRYFEMLETAKEWFLEDKPFRNKIIISALAFVESYHGDISDIKSDSIDFQFFLSAEIDSIDLPIFKSFRHALDYKLKEVAGLLIKAENRVHILLYAGNLDPCISAAVDKIHQLPEYENYILFNKIEKTKQKQTLTFSRPIEPLAATHTDTQVDPSLVVAEREHSPVIAGIARYGIFDMPENPSYQSLFLVLSNVIKNARDPASALELLNELQQLIVDYQRAILVSSTSKSKPAATSKMDTDKGINYGKFLSQQ